MKAGTTSRTAIAAASMRAAHLHLYDGPKIFEDTFALAMTGIDGPDALRATLERRPNPHLRRVAAFFALRHRYSENRLKEAIARGVEQVVLLGAGLDTFALRNPHIVEGVTYFEIDHPDSQRSKRERLAQLGLATPSVQYVPVDFARQNLPEELAIAGVSSDRATFFAWLGVAQYVAEAVAHDTMAMALRHAKGSEIVFDVILPFEELDPTERAISTGAAAMSAEFGEPWLSFFRPEHLKEELLTMGFSEVDCLTKQKAAALYYKDQPIEPLAAWQMMSALA